MRDIIAKKKCTIVQQGVWHLNKESMPLAAGYILAALQADTFTSENVDSCIKNFSGKATPIEIALTLIEVGVPDILGFSVLGWNYQNFIKVAEAVKQFNPKVIVVFGGNHVSHKAERVFHDCEFVDFVINGEGEFSFVELIRVLETNQDVQTVDGISYRKPDGTQVTTRDRDRIRNLEDIPSPVLSGAVKLTDETGEFKYDVALMETNRGCPYSCSFCYWGGATGQKVRTFPIERLAQEAEQLVKAGAETIVLCDANFGMLKQDLEFVKVIVELKKKYGRPTALETSWAKNKNRVFYEIVDMLFAADLKSSFTIALQSLNETVLDSMRRKNMKINDWKDLVGWLKSRKMDIYAELIWGAPGETLESFLDGYDEMAQHVCRIATYPILLLPNTEFGDNREKYGFKTIKGMDDDFDYVLSNSSSSIDEHLKAWEFLYWSRLLAENLVFRNIWSPAAKLADVRQSKIILSFANHTRSSSLPGAAVLADAARKTMADPDSLSPSLVFCFENQEFETLVYDWWHKTFSKLFKKEQRRFFHELLMYDLDTRPISSASLRNFSNFRSVAQDGVSYWQFENTYRFAIPEVLADLESGKQKRASARIREGSYCYTLKFRKGFEDFVASTNHEQTNYFAAQVTPTRTFEYVS